MGKEEGGSCPSRRHQVSGQEAGSQSNQPTVQGKHLGPVSPITPLLLVHPSLPSLQPSLAALLSLSSAFMTALLDSIMKAGKSQESFPNGGNPFGHTNHTQACSSAGPQSSGVGQVGTPSLREQPPLWPMDL